ncbi:hypothetical protein HanRHA438_Chr16g0786891 [Helianthus annuus]|nr:hypothetical protein HanRHA438_Chr16g0786891 [Helianthus annuus]
MQIRWIVTHLRRESPARFTSLRRITVTHSLTRSSNVLNEAPSAGKIHRSNCLRITVLVQSIKT